MLKTFSHAGKIKKTIIGEFKPKASRRAHKRTIYFALVVYKKEESAALLGDSKFLQTKVNTMARKQIGFMANPFLTGEDKTLVESDAEGSDAERAREDKV